MNQDRETRPVAHALTFVVSLGIVLLIPFLRQWPWIWAVPLFLYGLLVVLFPLLRRSIGWFRLGEFLGPVGWIAGAMMTVTSIALIAFDVLVRPDTTLFKEALPFQLLGGGILAAVAFSTLNATMEEFVFRGILFDALAAEYPIWFAAGMTSVLFGLGHLRGYPPGFVGATLAMLFGAMMAILRIRSRGLGLPVLVHVGADLTICSIVLR